MTATLRTIAHMLLLVSATAAELCAQSARRSISSRSGSFAAPKVNSKERFSATVCLCRARWSLASVFL